MKHRKLTTRAICRSWQAYALLSPIFFFLIIFMYYPPLLGLVRAFYRWAPDRPPVFVGLQNFRTYLTSPEVNRETINMIKLLLFGVFRGVAVPFAMAELVFSVRREWAKDLYRRLLVLPMLAPWIVIVLLWEHIYDPWFGLLNAIVGGIGLDALKGNWLGNPDTALYAIMGVGFPWVAAVGTLIYLGGLAQITESIFDSCLLDGCTGLRRILAIDLPLVLGQVRLQMILSVINALTAFNTILVLTDGGPGFATGVPALTMFKRAFMILEFGYGSAIGLMLFALAMLLTLLINRSLQPYAERPR